ncbi:MAG: type III-B CRISPR module-associated protein Cmr5 [Candidatus Asgardarchaeia archaeon]
MRTLEQERAKYAFDVVHEVKEKSSKVQESYNSYSKKAAVLILTNGLGNTLAYYKSKFKGKKFEELEEDDEKAYCLLYKHINNWLLRKINVAGNCEKDVLEWIIKDATSLQVYLLTREVVLLLNWIKRFADAELEREEERTSG